MDHNILPIIDGPDTHCWRCKIKLNDKPGGDYWDDDGNGTCRDCIAAMEDSSYQD